MISVTQQCYGRAEDRLFLVAVLLHSCLPPVVRSLFASQHAGTAAHLLRLVDERTGALEAECLGNVVLLLRLNAASHRRQ